MSESYEIEAHILNLANSQSLSEIGAAFGMTPGEVAQVLSGRARAFSDRTAGPAAESDTPNPRPGSKDHLITPFYDLLGAVPDADVAKKAGVSIRTIAGYRSRLGIAGYRGAKRRGDRTSAASSVRESASGVSFGDVAWLIHAESGDEGVVIASDIHGALAAAEEAGFVVIGMKRLGAVVGKA